MERFVNILVVDPDQLHLRGLHEILTGGGNNIIVTSNYEEGLRLANQREIGIALINTDEIASTHSDYLKRFEEGSRTKTMHKIALTKNASFGSKQLKVKT